jgi:16S rRNA (cytidine1402-2'-O)-methyltransferase
MRCTKMLKVNDMETGTLYIVSTPIGHPQDITLRALETLRVVDAVICEEARPGSTLLKKHDIQKPLILLNEHNEDQMVPEIIIRLLQGEKLALISDCGTPVFADPGRSLLEAAQQSSVRVKPVPGAASLTAAISVCKFDLGRFVFGGFLSRESQERRRSLADLQATKLPVILMDAPYRLRQLLEDAAFVFGQEHPVMLGCDLTLPGELILHGTLREVIARMGGRKCEYVVILSGRGGGSGGKYWHRRSGQRCK